MKQRYYIVLFVFLLSCSKEKLQTVYIASKGKKYFHAKGCRLQGNNKEAIGINDAISANYKACKFCQPSYKKVENKKYKRSFSAKKSTSVKCSARTKKGSRCSRKTRSSSGRCYQH